MAGLHALLAPAAHHLTQLLNETETFFAESALRLVCEATAVSVCERQGGLNLRGEKDE